MSDVYVPLKLRNRSQRTITLYTFSVRIFGETLGRPATLADLTDDLVSRHLARLVGEKKSPYTVNKERSQLLAIWNYAARKGHVQHFPDVEAERTPERVPQAWLEQELQRLLDACRLEQGSYHGVPAADWWVALHLVGWDTAERIGAMMALQWSDLSAERWLTVPAEIRKGRRQDKLFRLASDTVTALEAIRHPARKIIFDWPYSETYIYDKYKLILQRAGLPHDRRCKFHKIRRSTASHFKAAGGDPSQLLGHADPRTTKSYLDPRITGTAQPSDVLFRISQGRSTHDERGTRTDD